MKRIIGTLMGAGLLSSVLAVVATGPSSALPRDPCMDQANWFETDSWYSSSTQNYWDAMLGWASPDHYINPLSGQETWTANGMSVYNATDLAAKQSASVYDYNHAYAAQADWEGSHYPCP